MGEGEASGVGVAVAPNPDALPADSITLILRGEGNWLAEAAEKEERGGEAVAALLSDSSDCTSCTVGVR